MKKLITLVIPAGEKSEIHVLESLKKIKNKVEVIIVRGNNPSKNRNEGIKKSKTPLVAFLNAHSSVKNDWLENIISFFKNNPSVDVVGGPQHNSQNENSFGRSSGYAMSSRFGAGGIWQRYAGKNEIFNADETMLTSANLICRNKVFKNVLFNENLYPGEDPKFVSDLKKNNYSVAYSPKIIVYNERRKSSLLLAKQVFNYGFVRPQKESFMETAKKPFFFIPALFVLYLVSLPIILQYLSIYVLPLLLYIFLSIFMTIFILLKSKDVIASLLLPLVFIIIHLSYGLGFLAGYFKKII